MEKGLWRRVLLAAVVSSAFVSKGVPMAGQNQSDSIFRKPPPKLETRWYTYENKGGEKGAGGMAKFGRKGSPSLTLKPGEKVEATARLVAVEGRRLVFRVEARCRGEKIGEGQHERVVVNLNRFMEKILQSTS